VHEIDQICEKIRSAVFTSSDGYTLDFGVKQNIVEIIQEAFRYTSGNIVRLSCVCAYALYA